MNKRAKKLELYKLRNEIVARLLPLAPEKILLFGSYAYGHPTEESDIDLFIVKDLPADQLRDYKVEMKMRLHDLMKRYGVGFDLVIGKNDDLQNRQDYFYREELGKRAKVLYE